MSRKGITTFFLAAALGLFVVSLLLANTHVARMRDVPVNHNYGLVGGGLAIAGGLSLIAASIVNRKPTPGETLRDKLADPERKLEP